MGEYVHTALLDGAAGLVGLGVNWLVQSTLLIVAGLLVAWLLRRRGPAVQSVVCRTTLVAVLLCPAITWTLTLAGASGWSVPLPVAWSAVTPPVATTGAIEPSIVEPAESPPVQKAPVTAPESFGLPPAGPTSMTADVRLEEPVFDGPGEPRRGLASAPVATETEPPAVAEMPAPVIAAAPMVESPATPTLVVHGFGLAATCASLVWFVAVGGLLGRVAMTYRRLRRLRASAAGAEAETVDVCREVARLMQVAAPEVRHSPYLQSPCLAGLRRPAVLLPEASVAMRLHDVLIHELAHLRRRDCHWNLLGRVAMAVGFFQPLLWILVRRLRTAAEEVCDDYVVQFGGDRQAYAHGLVSIAAGSISPQVAGVGMVSLRSMLAKRIERIMDTSRSLSTRVGYLCLTLVLVGGLAGTAVVGLVGVGPRPVAAESGLQDFQDPSSGDDPAGDIPSDASSPGRDPAYGLDEEAAEENTVMGRVVNLQGEPVAGAELFWFRSRVHDLKPMAPRLLGKTDEAGVFRFVAPSTELPADEPAGWDYADRVIVRAPGQGPEQTSIRGLLHPYNRPDDGFPQEWAKIEMPDGGEPIHGRIVDTQGRPVAGATVKTRLLLGHREAEGGTYELREARVRDDSPNIEWRVRTQNLLNRIEPVQYRDVYPQAVTDADGRFELRDLGAHTLAQLLVEGDGIEATEVLARNDPGETLVLKSDRHSRSRTYTLHGPRFEAVVRPSRPIEGRVFDLDTGRPIAGALVRAFRVAGNQLASSRELQHFATVTDGDGRYRITGMPTGKDNKLVAFTTGDVPYLASAATVDTTKKEAATTCDLRIKRGVWAEGRVFDSETDKPFVGEIEYYYFGTRKMRKQYPGLHDAYLDGRYWTDSNGEFRVPVLPGVRGILAYGHSNRGLDDEQIRRFPRGGGVESIKGARVFAGGTRFFSTEPHCIHSSNYHWLAEVFPQAGEESVRVDMPMMPGKSIRVFVRDADGNSIDGYRYYGYSLMSGWQKHGNLGRRHTPGSGFEVLELKPGERRKVFVYHHGLDQVAGTILTDKSDGEMTIQLQPAGRVTGRLVDEQGKPMTDATVRVDYTKLQKEKDAAIWGPHPELQVGSTRIPVDTEGRFELIGLIPGWKYSALVEAPRKDRRGRISRTALGQAFVDVTVESGEEKDLGDLVAKPPKPPKRPKKKPSAAKATSKSGGEATSARQPGGKGKAKKADASGTKGGPRRTSITGRVVGSDGKPIAGADVAAVGYSMAFRRGGDLRGSETLGQTTTDEGGRYELSVAGVPSKSHFLPRLIARGAGTGLAWQPLDPGAGGAGRSLILSDEEPIHVRLVDRQGKLAAGVRVSIEHVAKISKTGAYGDGVSYGYAKTTPKAWPQPGVTDGEGRLVIHGLSPDHGASLMIEGTDRFAPQTLRVNNEPPERRTESDRTYFPQTRNVKDGKEAVFTLAPAKIIEGTVRYADTRKPVPHARLSVLSSTRKSGWSGRVAGRADEQGRYRINPEPGIRFSVIAYPRDGEPYLVRRSDDIGWEDDDDAKQVDVALPRGVLVRGKVVDSTSGKPIAGASVQYIVEWDNNPYKKTGIIRGQGAMQLSGPDGRFTMAVLPGPGRLLAHGPGDQFVLKEISERELDRGKRGGQRNYANAIERIEPKPSDKSIEMTLTLERGRTVTGRMVDEEGKPVAKALVITRLKIYPTVRECRGDLSIAATDGRFEVSGLAEGQKYPFYFLDPENRLGATAMLGAGGKEPTVVLKPCGQARATLVDGEGHLLPGASLAGTSYVLEMVVTPGVYRYDWSVRWLGALAADSDRVSNVDHTNHAIRAMKSDKEGRLVFPALVPGATYRLIHLNKRPNIRKQFVARSGETVELGKIVIDRRKKPAETESKKEPGEAKKPSETTPPGDSADAKAAGQEPTPYLPIVIGPAEESPPELPAIDLKKRSPKTVRVVDQQGQPVAGATVTVGNWEDSSRACVYGLAEKTKTDSLGQATIRVPRGAVGAGLVAEADGYVKTSEQASLGGEPMLKLKPGRIVKVRAVDSRGKPLPEAFALLSPGNTSVWGHEFELDNSGVRVSPVIEPTRRWLRVVDGGGSKDASFRYSELIDVADPVAAGSDGVIEAVLRPGVRLEGRLDDSVPRPITGGYVDLKVMETGGHRLPSRGQKSWQWQDTTEVKPDGTFVFESLPPGAHAQLFVLVDGYQSANPRETELREYLQKNDAGTGEVVDRAVQRPGIWPRLVPLDEPVVRVTVPCRPTSAIDFRVVDPSGRPIVGAKVRFNPNGLFLGGDLFIPCTECFLPADLVKPGRKEFFQRQRDWAMDSFLCPKSDAEGIARVRNLPGVGSESYEVKAAGYVMPVHPTSPTSGMEYHERYAIVELAGAKTLHRTVTLERLVPRRPLEVIVVDEAGEPLEKIKLAVTEITADAGADRWQPWSIQRFGPIVSGESDDSGRTVLDCPTKIDGEPVRWVRVALRGNFDDAYVHTSVDLPPRKDGRVVRLTKADSRYGPGYINRKVTADYVDPATFVDASPSKMLEQLTEKPSLLLLRRLLAASKFDTAMPVKWKSPGYEDWGSGHPFRDGGFVVKRVKSSDGQRVVALCHVEPRGPKGISKRPPQAVFVFRPDGSLITMLGGGYSAQGHGENITLTHLGGAGDWIAWVSAFEQHGPFEHVSRWYRIGNATTPAMTVYHYANSNSWSPLQGKNRPPAEFGELGYGFNGRHIDYKLPGLTPEGLAVPRKILWDGRRNRFIGPVTQSFEGKPLYRVVTSESAEFEPLEVKPGEIVVTGGRRDFENWHNWTVVVPGSVAPGPTEYVARLMLTDGAGGEQWLTSKPLSPGQHMLQLQIDPTEQTDNESTVRVLVDGGPRDESVLTIGRIEIDARPSVAGQPVAVSSAAPVRLFDKKLADGKKSLVWKIVSRPAYSPRR